MHNNILDFLISESIIKEVENWMREFMADADYRMSEATKLRRIAENFMRILAPQL